MNTCKSCKNKIADKQFVICELCVSYFHLKCLGFGDMELKIMNERDGICYLCNRCRENSVQSQYRELKAQYDLLQRFILKIDTAVQEQKVPLNSVEMNVKNISEKLQPSLDDIMRANRITHKLVKDSSSVTEKKESFASVVKTVCVIKPKDDTQKRNVTKKAVMEKIDPIDVKVSGMINVSGGGVAIVCDTPKSLSDVKSIAEEKMSENYNITTPKPILPRVKISGLQEKFDADHIKRMILTQNDLPEKLADDFSVLSVQSTKRGIYYDAYIEMMPHLYKTVMQTAKLKVGWRICQVADAMDVRRCARCCSYDHLVKNCPESSQCCLKCGKNHLVKDCKSETASCVNCIRANKKFNLKLDCKHYASDRNCPAFVKANQKARDRISF